MIPNPQQFASDKYAGICPEAWAAMAEANSGHVPAYGDDPWTQRASDAFRELFEKSDAEVFFLHPGKALAETGRRDDGRASNKKRRAAKRTVFYSMQPTPSYPVAVLGARLRELRWKNSAWLATAETIAGWNGFEIRNAGSGRSPVRKRSG
jgi:hypothetical protein